MASFPDEDGEDPRIIYYNSCSEESAYKEEELSIELPIDLLCYICKTANECLHYLFMIEEYSDVEEVLDDTPTHIIKMYIDYL